MHRVRHRFDKLGARRIYTAGLAVTTTGLALAGLSLLSLASPYLSLAQAPHPFPCRTCRTGLALAGLSLAQRQLWLLYLSWSLLVGTGCGLLYLPVLKGCLLWHKDVGNSGLGSGLLQGRTRCTATPCALPSVHC